MKRSAVLLTSTLCLFVWTGAQAGEEERSFGDGTLPEHLAVYDVDDDGVLSVEEIQAMKDAREGRHERWREQWDTNEDGVIDDEEREAARETVRKRIEERRAHRFNEADSDGDGCLTFEEFSALPAVIEMAEAHPEAPARVFARLDANDDDCVSLEEFMAHLRHRRNDGWRTEEVYHRADQDDDGCLTLDEFSEIPAVVRKAQENPNAPARFYAELDRDEDGCLSLREFLPRTGGDGPGPGSGSGSGSGSDSGSGSGSGGSQP